MTIMFSPPQPAAGDAVPGLSVSVTGEVMVASVIVFFFLFIFLLILFLRANRCLGANPVLESSQPHFLFSSLPRRALDCLDPNVLKSLPVTVFSSVDFKDGIECAVCLSELANGEAVRILPGCRHGFHLECIDMWFGSNSTCPICRSSVDLKIVILWNLEQSPAINESALQQGMVVSVDGSGEGSSSSVSSGSRKPAGILTIDVESSDFALQLSRISVGDEVKSPTLASLRSMRRILGMGGRGFSSRGWDIEQEAPPPPASAAMEVIRYGLGGEGSSS